MEYDIVQPVEHWPLPGEPIFWRVIEVDADELRKMYPPAKDEKA